METTSVLPEKDNDLPANHAATATRVPDAVAKDPHAEWTGLRCAKCGAPIKSTSVPVCRSCGWYASLGTYVEVCPQWEEEEDASRQASQQAKPSHLQVWLSLLPRWAWILIISVVVVLVESVVARVITPADSQWRTTWSLVQLAIGTLAFVGFHIFNFLTVAADDAEMGLLDLVIRPLKTWLPTLRGLPSRLWIVDSAACGLTAVVMSLAVIGGIPYQVLWDWGFKEPPKQQLVGAVMSQIQKAEKEGGADNLEDAVRDFADSQSLDSEQPKPTPAAPSPREHIDCVILGFRVDAEGRVTMLTLGAAYQGKLAYAGEVAPQLIDEERAELAQQLNQVKRMHPFLPLQSTAIWVEPRFTCRVTYSKRSPSGRLNDIQWDKLLGKLRLE